MRFLPGQKKRGWCVAYSPDGRWLVVGGWQGPVTVWDLTGKEESRSWGTSLPIVQQALFLPGADTVALCASSDTLQLRRFPSGSVKQTVEPKQGTRYAGNVFFDPTYHPAHERVAGKILGGGNNEKALLGTLGGPLREVWQHGDMIRHLLFSPGGGLLATAGWDRRLVVGDADTGEVRLDWKGPARVNALFFASDDVLLAGVGHSVVCIDLTAGKPRWKFRAHRELVVSLALSRDGRNLVTASDDQTVAVWDGATRKLRHRFELPVWTDARDCVAVAPDGCTAAVAALDGRVALLDLDD